MLLRKGEDYCKLHRTICILITDYSLKKIKELEEAGTSFIEKQEEIDKLTYHTEWVIEEKRARVILINKIEIHIISLAEIREQEKIKEEDEILLDWLEFLENPKSRRLIEKMKENKALQEAEEKLDSLSEDERMQRIADLREKAILDEKAIRKAGEIRGREEGIKENKEQTAKNMLKENLDTEITERVTGLSKEEIERLRE